MGAAVLASHRDCGAVAIVTARTFPDNLRTVGNTRCVAHHSDAYCQYLRTPRSHGRSQEREGTQVLGPAAPMTLVSIAQSGTTVTIGGITREI